MNGDETRQEVGRSGRQYEVRTSAKGIDYVRAVLQQKKTRSTQAVFWKIPHKTKPVEISLRIGRYVRTAGEDVPGQSNPRSELTLSGEELDGLVDFIEDNLDPLRSGARRYLVFDDAEEGEKVESLRRLFGDTDTQRLVEFLVEHEIVPDNLRRSLEHQARCAAVEELERMLAADLPEADWQGWFQENDWILGSEFVELVGERAIDTAHIADYLMRAYDGFLDIVEIKRPEGKLRFWSSATDHGNPIPHQDLVKAITQAQRYLFEVERESNSVKFATRTGVATVKPRSTLIFGRSNDWSDDQRQAYRILNAGLHNIQVMTYDHVLARARRMLGMGTDQAVSR